MYSKLNVPFKRGIFSTEKELDFLFNIGTLEAACKRLGIEFWQMGEHDSFEFTLAILFEGYLQACRYEYKKPKYNFAHATYWMEHMSRKDSLAFTGYMSDLMGRLQKSVSGKAEKKK
jgi:hypothetical protein